MLTSPVFETESHQSTAARYESLIRIAAAVRSQKESQDLFGLLVEELGQVVQFDAIAQFDESSNKVHWHMCSGCRKPDSLPSEMDKEGTLAAWVYRHQETVTLSNLDRETRFPASIDLMRQAGLQSVCAFPLSTAHRRLGSLVIGSIHRNAYSPEEIRFCSLVALKLDAHLSGFRRVERQRSKKKHILELNRAVKRTAPERFEGHFQVTRSRNERLACLQPVLGEQPLLFHRELAREYGLWRCFKQNVFQQRMRRRSGCSHSNLAPSSPVHYRRRLFAAQRECVKEGVGSRIVHLARGRKDGTDG